MRTTPYFHLLDTRKPKDGMKRLLVLLLVALPLLAGKAKIYNLQTGKMTILEYKWNGFTQKGHMKGVLPSGEKVEGDVKMIGPDNSDRRGSVVLAGDGIVLDCDLQASLGGGIGQCADNKGVRYKLTF